jgi:hypothetical protein
MFTPGCMEAPAITNETGRGQEHKNGIAKTQARNSITPKPKTIF